MPTETETEIETETDAPIIEAVTDAAPSTGTAIESSASSEDGADDAGDENTPGLALEAEPVHESDEDEPTPEEIAAREAEAAAAATEAAQRAFVEAMEAEVAGVRECLEALRGLPHTNEPPPLESAIQGLRIAAEALRDKQAQHPHSTPAGAVQAIEGLADGLRTLRHLVAFYRHLVVLLDNKWIDHQSLRAALTAGAAFDPTLPKR